VGDAAATVTKSSGKHYFAAKSGRCAAEQIVAASANGNTIPTEKDLKFISRSGIASTGRHLQGLENLQNIFLSQRRRQEKPSSEMCDDKMFNASPSTATSTSGCDDEILAADQRTRSTFASVLRGTPCSPGYKPVPSAVQNRGGDGCPAAPSLQCRGTANRHSLIAPEGATPSNGNSAAGHSKAGSGVGHDQTCILNNVREPALASKP